MKPSFSLVFLILTILFLFLLLNLLFFKRRNEKIRQVLRYIMIAFYCLLLGFLLGFNVSLKYFSITDEVLVNSFWKLYARYTLVTFIIMSVIETILKILVDKKVPPPPLHLVFLGMKKTDGFIPTNRDLWEFGEK